MSPAFSFGKCALLIAHPGHEIRVHGWVEQARPTVYILTDGSGRSGKSRLASTMRVLKQAGAQMGSIFGRATDRTFYDAVLRRDLRFFRTLIGRLSQELADQQFDFVLGDGADGSILAHDIWRGMIDAAVDIASATLNRRIPNYEFALEGPPAPPSKEHHDLDLVLELDENALARKIAAARNYPELSVEVEANLSAHGEEAFGIEWLKPTGQRRNHHRTIPAYEQHGATLVQAGIYPEVVRYEQHVRPLLAAIQQPRAA